MPDDSLEKFDSLVAALERLRQLHPGPEADMAAEALTFAPAIRDRLKTSIPRLTKAEIQAIDSEIAVKLKDEITKLERMRRTMDVADITDIYWPYLVKYLG